MLICAILPFSLITYLCGMPLKEYSFDQLLFSIIVQAIYKHMIHRCLKISVRQMLILENIFTVISSHGIQNLPIAGKMRVICSEVQ